MYKTIRHGENSLQYTILPQHDDYKGVDGKLRPIVKGGRKKRSLMAFIGLFFVCSIITGAILVPLMVSVEFMSSPTSWFYKQQQQSHHSPKGSANNSINLTNKLSNKNKTLSTSSVTDKEILDINHSEQTKPDLNISTEESTTPVTYLSQKQLQSSSTLSTNLVSINDAPVQDISTSVMDDNLPILSMTTASSTTTVAADDVTTYKLIKQLLSTNKPPYSSTNQDIKTSKPLILTKPEINNVIMQTATQTPPSPPPPQNLNNNVVNPPADDTETRKHKETKNWLKSHWPIVDPSTYFQWTDYESEDNILLPAIFCTAVVAVIIFVLLCVVMKHNKKCFSCTRKRNEFLAVEAQNGDNATLLTNNEYPSDDE